MKSLASVLNELAFRTRLQTKVVTLATLVFLSAAHAAEPLIQWATASGGPGGDAPSGLALTFGGRLVMVGDFDSSPAADGFYRPKQVLHTFDADGHLVSSLASRGESLRAVVVNSIGDVFTAGQVWNSKSLGVGRTNDFYLAKYSAAGSLLWERIAGTPTYSRLLPFDLGGLAIALDPSGNVCVAGGSTGPAVFGNTTFPARAGGPLICKYTANGDLAWAKRVEGAPDVLGLGGSARSIAVDSQGNILVGGNLNNGAADFGGLVVTVAGPYSSDSFIAKFNSSGVVQWVRLGHGGGITIDRSGNIYSVGTIWLSGEFALHFGKFVPAGNLAWERTIFGASGGSITLDGKGEPVFSANLYATAQLDDLIVPYNGFGSGSNFPEVLICKADATGRFRWAITESGAAIGGAGPILCDRNGNSYLAGVIGCAVDNGSVFCGTGTLGSYPLEMPYPNGDYSRDVFVARLFDADAVVPELKITRTLSGVELSWPVEATNHVLEATTSLPAVSWDVVTNTPTITTNKRSVQLPLTGTARFFRLRRP